VGFKVSTNAVVSFISVAVAVLIVFLNIISCDRYATCIKNVKTTEVCGKP